MRVGLQNKIKRVLQQERKENTEARPSDKLEIQTYMGGEWETYTVFRDTHGQEEVAKRAFARLRENPTLLKYRLVRVKTVEEIIWDW